MSENSKIEIKSKNGTLIELYIDGHLIRGVRSLKFEKSSRKMPTLTIDMNALNISIDTPAVVQQEGYGEMEISFKDGCTVFKK